MKYNEVSHFSHPEHRLTYDYTQIPFKCDGCNEPGIGSHYKCTTCDHDLHVHCALPSPSISHPFYTKCTFQFLTTPPGSAPRYCNACQKDIYGFVYHCKACGFDLHPCCAKLPAMLDDGEVKLYLCRKVGSAYHKCGKKGRSWSYRSTCKKYNLHVACAKEMLAESWNDIYYCGVRVGEDDDYYNSMYGQNWKLETKIPSLKGTLQSYHKKGPKRKGKIKKCCKIAGLAVQFVISAILGDPTTLIAGVVGALISK
ncbi:protein VACUOLELESS GAMETOPHYTES-like [Bidens hawaiensis]|uniref:protein VACUOLELESS GAMETOPHYTES-like n=1 Tax=Bidens hawaiensis TaxID=980011 RepID=UPI00404AB2BA